MACYVFECYQFDMYCVQKSDIFLWMKERLSLTQGNLVGISSNYGNAWLAMSSITEKKYASCGS